LLREQGATVSTEGFLEMEVPRTKVENNLLALKSNGFGREDIFRMLDKGPWIVGFDVTSSINKIFTDMQVSTSKLYNF